MLVETSLQTTNKDQAVLAVLVDQAQQDLLDRISLAHQVALAEQLVMPQVKQAAVAVVAVLVA